MLLSLVALVVGLIKPSVFKLSSRKKVSSIFVGSLILFFILFGVTAPSDTQVNSDVTVAPNAPVTATSAPTLANSSNKTTDKAVPAKQPQVVTPVTAPTQPAFATFKNGNYIVGTDIKAGTYRTRTASAGCYFSRLSGFSGGLSDIISNENTDAPAVVTISANDKGFVSSRCGTWTQDLSQITASNTTFGAGTYIVGTDMKAGTYKSSGSEGCYYSRLSGFGGGMSGIISNNNTDTSAIVTIAPTDKGFTSTRCGTWSLIN